MRNYWILILFSILICSQTKAEGEEYCQEYLKGKAGYEKFWSVTSSGEVKMNTKALTEAQKEGKIKYVKSEDYFRIETPGKMIWNDDTAVIVNLRDNKISSLKRITLSDDKRDEALTTSFKYNNGVCYPNEERWPERFIANYKPSFNLELCKKLQKMEDEFSCLCDNKSINERVANLLDDYKVAAYHQAHSNKALLKKTDQTQTHKRDSGVINRASDLLAQCRRTYGVKDAFADESFLSESWQQLPLDKQQKKTN